MEKLWSTVSGDGRRSPCATISSSGGSEIVTSKPDEFRQVMERDYAKYGKLSDLFKTVQ